MTLVPRNALRDAIVTIFDPKGSPKGASGGPVEGQNPLFFQPWACLVANVALESPKARFGEDFLLILARFGRFSSRFLVICSTSCYL